MQVWNVVDLAGAVAVRDAHDDGLPASQSGAAVQRRPINVTEVDTRAAIFNRTANLRPGRSLHRAACVSGQTQCSRLLPSRPPSSAWRSRPPVPHLD